MNYNSYPNHSNSAQSTPWDDMRRIPYTPEVSKVPEKTPLHRKAEIANYLINNSMPSDHSTISLNEQEIENTYCTIMQNRDGLSSVETTFMKQIDTPLGHDFENSQDVFSSLNEREQKILGYLSGVGFNNHKQNRNSDLEFIVNRYPAPIALIPQMNHLLELIAEQNNPAKAEQYTKAFDNFERKVYGERYEYSKAFDEISSDAENYYFEHEWAQRLDTERPKLLYKTGTESQSIPLEDSQYRTPDLNHQNREESSYESANEQFNRHKAKIINSLVTGQHVTEVDGSVTSAGARETIYGWFNNGQLTPSYESRFLQTIAPPIRTENDLEKVFNKLESSRERDILAFASGHGFGSHFLVDAFDLQTVIKMYPTPVEFQAIEDKSLDNLRRNPANSPEIIAEYQKSFETFKQKFYGKRQEYHEAWKELEKEAKADDRRVIVKPHDTDTVEAEPKKGIFGRIFGRKK